MGAIANVHNESKFQDPGMIENWGKSLYNSLASIFSGGDTNAVAPRQNISPIATYDTF